MLTQHVTLAAAALLASELAAQYKKLVTSGTLTEEEFWRTKTVSKLWGWDSLASGIVQKKGISNKLPDIMKCLELNNMGQATLHVRPWLYGFGQGAGLEGV